MNKRISVSTLPTGSTCAETGLYSSIDGKKIVFLLPSQGTGSQDITIQVPDPVFIDGPDTELLGLGSAVSWNVRNKLFTLNPVYHHKFDLAAKIVVQPDNACVQSADGTFALNRSGTWADPVSPAKWAETTFMVASPYNRVTARTPSERWYTYDLYAIAYLRADLQWMPQLGYHNCYTYSMQVGFVGSANDGLVWNYLTPGLSAKLFSETSSSAILLTLQEYCRETHTTDPGALISILREKLQHILVNAPEWTGTTMSYGTVVSDIHSSADPAYLRALIQSKIPGFSVDSKHSFRAKFAWGDLASDAYSDIGFADNNGIAYLKDALELKSAVVGQVETLHNVVASQGKKRAKALAQTYLSNHYGTKLMLMDTASYIKELRKNRYLDRIHRCASSETKSESNNWTLTAHYQVYYKEKQTSASSEIDLVNKFLERVDFMPTLENIWDMVPYSFVADWFTSVGDNLTRIGNLGVLRAYYTVLGCTESVRAVRNIPIASSEGTLQLEGSIQEVVYERRCKQQATVPSLYTSHSPSSLLNHWVEGAALVVAK